SDPPGRVLTHEQDPVAAPRRETRETPQGSESEPLRPGPALLEGREHVRVAKARDGRTRRAGRRVLAGREVEVRAPGARAGCRRQERVAELLGPAGLRQDLDLEVAKRRECRRD